MNKALEQKLIGSLEESHTKEQSPKAVLWVELWSRRSKMAARWARLRFELWEDFFWRKTKWVGAGLSGRGPRGVHKAGGRALGGWAHPVPSWPDDGSPWCVLSARYSQIFQKKSYLNFRAFGELLFSGYFYIAWIIRKQTEITIFALFNMNNRK